MSNSSAESSRMADALAPDPGRSRWNAPRASGALYPIISLLLCILLWDLAVRYLRLPPYLIPPPSAVARVFVERFAYLIGHTWVTTVETVLGFVASVAIGVPLALAIVWSRLVERTLYPILVLSQAVPKVALAPLLLVWIGFGLTTKVVVAVLVAFFPIVISLVVGLRGVPGEMIELGRSMGLGPVQMFLKIRLPHALPSLFGGLKVAITLAVVGAVVGEFVGADRGLGYVILLASGQLAERLALPWHPSVRMVEGTM
jgi:NitT/TauT family transport system permease protein